MSHKNQRVTIHATGLQGPSAIPVVSSEAPKFVKPERPPASASASTNKHHPRTSVRPDESSDVLERRHVNDQAANLLEDLIMFEDDFYSTGRSPQSSATRRLATNWNRESDFYDEPVPFLSAKEVKRVASDAARRRKVARQGIPASQRCQIWEKFIFVNCRRGQELSYDAKMKQLFSSTKGVMPPSVKAPDFGSPVRLRSAASGGGPVMESVQSVLCLLASDFPALSYCVPLVDLVFLLLLHMPLNQAYTCAAAIVKRSLADGFYLPTSHNTLARYVMTFGELLRAKASDLHEHLVATGVDIDALFLSWVSRMFVSFLPLPKICRLLDMFFLEGKHALFIYPIYALMRYSKPLRSYRTAQALTEAVNLVIYESPSHFLDQCFKMSFGAEHIQNLEGSHKDLVRTPVPRIMGFHVPTMLNSELVDAIECVRLWEWLPAQLSARDPVLLFSSTSHGSRLHALQSAMGKRQGQESILLVQDLQYNVFGVVLFQPWQNCSTIDGVRCFDLRTFMFSLRPRCRRYACVRDGHVDSSSDDEEESKERTPEPPIKVVQAMTLETKGGDSPSPKDREEPVETNGGEDNNAPSPNKDSETTGEESSPSSAVSAQLPDTLSRTPSRLPPKFVESADEQLEQLRTAVAPSTVPRVFMRSHADYVGIGDDVGIVFALDSCLKQGVSQPSEVFKNPSLSPLAEEGTGLFPVLAVELWGFQSSYLPAEKGEDDDLDSIDTMRERYNSVQE